MQWMLQNFCEFSIDYPGLLRRLKDPLSMRASERILQFPFTLPTIEEKTEEELARIAERKREQGRKLQEIAAKARQEKVCHSRAFGCEPSVNSCTSWHRRRMTCSVC